MPNKVKEYQRLPGRKRGLTGDSTLWLGQDHLLRVDSQGFAENYKRFYYRDIQSIVILPTSRQHSRLAGWAAASIPLALLAWFLGGGWGIFLGCLAGLAGTMFVANWLRGPICECWLQTAVQTETLPSLSRLRATLNALNRLRVRIEAIQGKLRPEFFGTELPSGIAEPGSGRSSAPPAGFSRPSQLPLQPGSLLPHSSGFAHAVLFSLLVLDAVLSAIDITVNHLILTLAEMLLSVGLLIAVVAALIQQSRTDIGRFLRWQALASLGYVCVSFLLSSAYSAVLPAEKPKRMENEWDMIVAVSRTSAQESTWLMSMILFSIVASLVIAVPGWISLAKFWAKPAERTSGEQGDSLGLV